MKILHISTRLIVGGSQENTILSCEGQSRRGHEVHLAFGPQFGPEGSMVQRIDRFNTDNPNPIQTHIVHDLVREVAPLKDFRCLRALTDLVRAVEPDIVHTHSSKAGILGRLAAWKIAKHRPSDHPLAVVHTIHGPPFMPPEGSQSQRLRTHLMNHLYTLAERHAAKHCHAIVSVADAMTEQFLSRHIGTPDLYTTVRSGMETAPYLDPIAPEERSTTRRALGIPEDATLIATIARLAPHKGHEDIMVALREDLIRDPRLHLLWIGDGPWRQRLVDRLELLGITKRVTLTGLVQPEDIPELVRAADILIHPSSREGLPRTVVQAMLAGLGVVAYDADGTREVVIDKQTGRLVPVGDIIALREAVEWMIEDDERRIAIGRHAREHCRETFDHQRMVDALETVYARALKRSRRSHA